ncbi:MAG: FAD-dependent oxidoreductase [Acidobacteriaceae bacterium]
MRKHKKAFSAGLWIAIVVFMQLCANAVERSSSPRSYDVVIAGAGTGGFSAAIQSARLGAKVALLEESDWIGGQMAAAGVSTMDEAYHMTPPSGIYAEFLGRMATYYRTRGKVVGTCYSYDASHCYEPSAIRKILTDMIAEVNAGSGKTKDGHIDLYLQDRVVHVLSDGNTVTGVVTERGMTLHSKVLIDATEFGDVLPLTPAAYRSGPSVGVDRNDSCTQDITYAMIIKKYPGGAPKELQMLHPPLDMSSGYRC